MTARAQDARRETAAGARKIVLASRSAVRAQLLRNAGVSFEVRAADIDEEAVLAQKISDRSGGARLAALELAEAKAMAIDADAAAHVIGADQILSMDGALRFKARDAAEATERLMEMRGRSHDLTTAVVIASGGRIVWRWVEATRVRMRRYSRRDVEAYVAAAGPSALASVACYEIEALGAQLIDRIDGDMFAALGLPLLPLLSGLRAIGAEPAEPIQETYG